MLRIILTVIIAAVLIFSIGCKKQQPQPAPPKTPAEAQKEIEEGVTKENMDQQLEKIEKEIKADVNAK